jgi:hypothetical protein
MGNLSSAAATTAAQVVTNHVRVSATMLWYFVYLNAGRCGPLGVLTGLNMKNAVVVLSCILNKLQS